MKQWIKHGLALLLALVMVISLLPAAAFAEDGIVSERSYLFETSGYIPVDLPGGRAVTSAYLRGDTAELNSLNPGAATQSLPAAYDSRDYGYITSVKNQNPYGTCWTFGTMAPIEAYMIKNGIIDGDTGTAAKSSMDLSELHLAWFNYTSAYDKEGMLTGDSSKPLGDTYLDQGGNGAMSTLTVMRWAGTASENTAALKYSAASTSGLSSQYAYAYNNAHVSNVTWIPTANRDAVKQAIMDYGAGGISYYHSDSYYNSSTGAYCFKQSATYGSSSYQYGNHAVTVVGWDDNYARTNFKSSNRPTSNGAWIIKNSWGTSWGNSGYFYLSYEDTASLDDTCFFYTAEAVDNYDHNYQYDGTCNVANYQAMNNNCQVANVFTAKGSEELKAVAIAPWDEATTYTLQIYKNLTSSKNPSSGTLVSSQSGYFTYSGYYTVPLDTPVSLAAGDTFSVVFTLSTPTKDADDGKYVHIPYDASNKISWAQWVHANHGDTSFYRESGGSWTDCPSNGDFRIKAYTNDVTFRVTAESNNTAYGTVSVSGTKITASPKDGYYVSDAQVTSGTATVSISGNTISVSPSSDCTVKVIFAPKPQFTISFSSCGAAAGSKTAYIQDTIQLPTTVSNTPDGWTFVGWAEQQIAETSTAPSFFAPGADYVVSANATLYALFTRTEGSDEIIYEIVADPITDWTGSYVITCGKDASLYALKGLSGNTSYESSSAGGTVAFASTGMTLDGTALRNVSSAYVFTAAPSGTGWTLKNDATGTWLGSYSSYLYSRSTMSTSYCIWDLEYDTYNICMKVSNAASSRYPYLVKGSSYFVINSGYTTNKTQFWKKTTASTTFYNTDPIIQTHTHTLSLTPATAPTCTEAGNIAYYTCSGCGKLFSDAQGENEIASADTILPATGHTPGQSTEENRTAPTCGAAGGYDTVIRCATCGAELSRTHTELPATGEHTWGAWTAKNNGTHARTCSICGKSESANCTYTDTVTPPTVTDQGYTTHTCTICGYSFRDSYTAPIGTDYLVSFSVPAGVAAIDPMSCNSNSSITLPAAGAPDGCTFLGWVTAPIDKTASKPASILTGAFTPTENITLYALYSFTEGSGATGFKLLTAMPSDLTGSYVITSGTTASAYMMAATTGNYYNSTAGRTLISSSGASLDGDLLTNVPQANIFEVAAASRSGYYTIRPTSISGRYVADGSRGLTTATSQTNYGQWKFTLSSGRFVIPSYGYSSYAISFTGTYFDTVRSSSGIYLWKQTETGATFYATSIDAETPDDPEPPTPETFTLSFSVPQGVSAVADLTVTAGSSITLPTAGAPAGCTFLGWVTQDYAAATAMPSDIRTGSFTPTKSQSFKALYAKTQTGAAGYQLLTSAPSDWSGDYVITSGSNSSLYALKGLSGNTRYESTSAGGAIALASTGMTLSGSTLTNVGSAYIFHISSYSGKYVIQNASTGTYLASRSSYLYSYTSKSTSYCLWSLSASGSAITAANSASSSYPYLSFSSSKYFMINRTAGSTIRFWKLTEGETTIYTTAP